MRGLFLFFLGAIFGCSLGIFFAAVLIKFKETDESASEIIRETPTGGTIDIRE
jgi:hypothetical protein